MAATWVFGTQQRAPWGRHNTTRVPRAHQRRHGCIRVQPSCTVDTSASPRAAVAWGSQHHRFMGIKAHKWAVVVAAGSAKARKALVP